MGWKDTQTISREKAMAAIMERLELLTNEGVANVLEAVMDDIGPDGGCLYGSNFHVTNNKPTQS